MMPLINLVGKRFGRLRVVDGPIRQGNIKPKWKCVCDCGKTIVTSGDNLKGGGTQSCGCLQLEVISRIAAKHTRTHGEGRMTTPEYRCWQAIKTRCYNPKHKFYRLYGGMGVTICSRWLNSYENFLADMGRKPTPKHSIDRFPDPDGNYEPGNCRWATAKEQAGNKRKRVK